MLRRLPWIAVALPLLTACPPGRDCDADRDGWESERCGGDDCNDASYLVSPDSPEICDGLDNDCDGAADLPTPADPPTWYRDGDGDGYGDSADTAAGCSAPAGYVNNGLDCDDARTLVRPGAIEVCDGQDNDCDGDTDEDDASLAPDWWRDGDGDGYGNATSAVLAACAAPEGYINNRDDCDDSDADVHPGAAEVCADGIDNDCDGGGCGVWGDLDIDVAAAVTVLGLVPGQGLGRSVSVAALDSSGALGVVIAPEVVALGEAAYWFADPLGAGATTDSADARITGAAWAGGLGTGGDATGDGIDDLFLGAPDGADVYLFGGPLDEDRVAGSADATGVGPIESGYGERVAILPDLNGDGIDDLAVGAPMSGQVFVFLGGPSVSLDPADAVMTLQGSGGGFGWSILGLPDVSGDGLPEIVVGAPFEADGSVAIFSGLTAGVVPLEDAWSIFSNIEGTWGIGFDVSTPGDLDGDGVPELMSAGSVELEGGEGFTCAWIWSPTAGTSDVGDAALRLIGEPWALGLYADQLHAAPVGDLDGDGFESMALAWPGPEGAVVALWEIDNLDGRTLRIEDADAVLTGLALYDGRHTPRMAALGDADGDGFDDLVVTEPARNDASGGFHVLLGGPGL